MNHRTIQVEAFGVSSATMRRYIAVECSQAYCLGFPGRHGCSPTGLRGCREDRSIGVGRSQMTADACQIKSGGPPQRLVWKADAKAPKHLLGLDQGQMELIATRRG